MINMRWILPFLTIVSLAVTGCTVGSPTSPLPSFGVDIVEATVDPSSVTVSINEGDIAHITITFERALKVQAYVNWEIIGGIGRFIRPNGFAIAPAGATSITLDLESYRNQTIEAPADLTVNITSDSFEEAVEATIHLTDPTLPANLTFQQSDPHQLPTSAIGNTVSTTVVVENTGEVSASGISASSLAAPFSYTGGAYPGTGGNCGSLLQAGQSCTIKVDSMMVTPGTATDDITLNYNDGQGAQSAVLNLEAFSDSVVATLSGTPSALSNATVLNVDVGGISITQYQYKVGVAASTDCSVGAGYSGWISAATNITNNISGLADGSIRLCVVGHDGSNPQSYSSATFYSWVKDTAPPTSTGIIINNNAIATSNLNVTLALSAVGAQFMYVTNISTCNSGGTWEMYSDTKSWTLSTPNAANSIYVKYRDQLGNESSCVNDSINHDNIAPTVTINQDVAQADPTLSAPVLFKVVFSEPVDLSSFSTSAIEQKGSATGINWSLTQTGPSTFDLQAVSVDVGGTLMPEVRAGQVQDLAGNLNSISTSTDNSVAFNMVEFFFRSLALGNEHTCATSNEGKTYCWGSHSDGQLGIGAGSTKLVPTAVNMSNVTSGGFAKLSLGDNFTCGLTKSGTTMCWGRGTEYQTARDPAASANVPVLTENTWSSINYGWAEKDFVDLVTGKNFVCNLNYRGRIYCWGKNTHGQFGNGTTTDLETERSTDYLDMASYPAFKNLKKLVAGDEHVCGLTSEGKAVCWGRGTEGQIGDNGGVDRLVPTAVNVAGIVDFDGFTDITAGGDHTCAVTADGKVYCWGENSNGELGNNSTTDALTPVQVDATGITTAKTFVEVKAGRTHTCGRMIDGLVYCWGSSTDGKLGGTYGVDQLVPVNVKIGSNPLKTIVGLEVGRAHSCAITADGKAMCWGQQSADGRLGNNATASSADPVAVDVSALLGKRSLKQISSGTSNSCAVNTQGRVYCWGRGDEGQNGNSFSDYLTPNEILTTGTGGSLFAKVVVGNQHACALSTEGKVYCWGENGEGQLGNGGNVDNPTPAIVDTSTITPFLGFKDISAGSNHTCGLHADGKIYCWGYGFFGQLGRNSSFSANRPVAVVTASTPGLTKFIAVDAGSMHTCGLGANGLLYCWGYGALGRLGTGNTLDRMIPTAVVTTSFPSKDRVVSFSAGNENTCAILSNNTKAWCWGAGTHGKNGDFTELSRTSPVQMDTVGIPNFYQFKSLDVGQEHGCGITNRDTLVCWGEGALGRIGDGPELYRTRPVPANFSAFAGYNGAVGVSSGGSFACSWSYAGEQFCWGEGLEGRLGNNLTANKETPAKMVYP